MLLSDDMLNDNQSEATAKCDHFNGRYVVSPEIRDLIPEV